MDTAGEKCSPSTVANGDESLQAAMASQRAPASNSIPAAPPELRLVLLGRKGAGKSAAGNTILGGAGRFESGKPTEECVTRRADVAGRRVTVVDTPGWEWYYPLNNTPNWVRRETLRSVSLCPPGPHVVLLVVRSCASVTDAYIREIEEHLEPLGRAVWGHAMLLFTRGDELGLTSMEQRILTSGPALQRLLHMCGGSYCVVNNLSKGDGTQAGELIRKLGKKGGNIGHLEMDNAVLSGLEADGKRGARERRRKQRQMEAQVQRGIIKAALMSDAPQGSELDAHRSLSRAPRRLPEVRLVLLGERETGKSSAGNTILCEAGFFQAGSVTEECVRRQSEVAQRFVTVVDTPGWEAGVAGATPERVKREIVGSVALCPPGPHALLLMLRVDTLVRAGHVREHLELLGEGVWRHTILLFTHGDQLREGVDIEQHIQGGGRDLQWLLEKCRGRCHILSSVDGGGRGSGGSTKVTELLKKVEKMASLNRCEAFSSLVQDVRDLSRQRNEKFDQRLKEVGDKMLRREVELKNMREREMKSIRWFFDRKKKVKSPGKADVQKEEEEDDDDRRIGERKHDIGELEERMHWLTEDKEKEIQDLSIENERIRVSLNQSRRERDGAMLNLEQRETEIEELKERSDEQQAKLLDLERATVENEHEREQREDATRAKTQEWRKEVEENLELHKNEKAEWMKKIESLEAEMDETKRHCGDVLRRKEEENNREVTRLEEKLKREMEIKLVEKDKEQNELRRKAIREIQLQHEEEMARKISESTEKVKVQHQEDIDQSLKEKAHEMERVRQRHDNEIRDMQRENQRQVTNLKKQFEKENEDHVEAKKKEMAELEQKYHAHMKEKILENEKEKEMIHVNHKKHMAQKIREEERDTEALKLAHQKEKDGKTKEHKEDMERVQQQYMDKIRDIEKERRRETEEHREQVAKETAKQLQEREMEIKELKLKYSAEMEEKNLENEKEKEIINRNKDKCILERLQERDRQTEELKRQHVEEVEERMRQSEKEKERCKKETEEKETEMEEMKLNVKELKKRLQQEEEKEADRLNYKNHIEQRLEEKDKEFEKMKLNVDKMKEKLQQGEEEESDRRHHRREMEQRLEDKDREIDEIRERLIQLQQTLRRTEEEREADRLTPKRQMGQKLEENERVGERAMEEMKLQQRKLKEKEAEIDSRETRWREEQKEKDEKRENEMNKLIEIVDEKTAEIRQAECRLAQKDSEVDEAKRTCASYFKEIEDLKESNENQTSSVIEMQRRQRTKDAEMLERLRDKDEELEHLRRRDGNEIVQLKLTIEQTKSELKELTKKMEIAMTSMIREYEKEIARAKENMESVAREKDDALTRLEEESRKSILSVTEKYEESRKRGEELQEQREKMRIEADNFKLKYEELKEESEEEVRKHFRGYEEKESEIQSVLAERDRAIGVLTGANDKLQAEVVGTRERLSEAEAQMNELRETFERQLTEKQREFRTKEEEIEEKQKEIQQRERDVGRNEGELRERGLRLDAKGVELTEKEVKLGGEERELRNLEGNLETQQKERKRRARNAEETERQIESLLRALEGKQQELSGHGQDLQRKVKGLKEKEHCLKQEEQELLCWKSELQMRNEHVNATTQQLDEMVRDLTSLREELDQREKTVKMSLERLGKWEARLEAREAELNEVERGQREADNHASGEGLAHEANLFSAGAAVERPEDDVHIMYSEVSGRRDKGREGDRGERIKDREDQTTKMARSAVKVNKCHIGTLEEIDGSEEKEGMGGRGAETRDPERERVMQECRSFSQSQGHGSSNNDHSPTVDLRVLVLGESWSSRSPAGVTILGGEVPTHDGSTTFRSWRGQIAARHLAVVEPLGLRWRDGPDPTNTSLRKGLLDSIAWCHPGPHVVLLLMPAFVTCTRKYRRAVEEHVGSLGEGIWQRAVVLFTWGETLGVSAEQHILRNGELLGLVEKCGGGYHVLTGKKTNSGTERLLEKMEEVMALNSGD